MMFFFAELPLMISLASFNMNKSQSVEPTEELDNNNNNVPPNKKKMKRLAN